MPIHTGQRHSPRTCRQAMASTAMWMHLNTRRWDAVGWGAGTPTFGARGAASWLLTSKERHRVLSPLALRNRRGRGRTRRVAHLTAAGGAGAFRLDFFKKILK